MPPSSYRYPNEIPILAGTLLLVLLVIALTATATLCISVVFVLAVVALAYVASRAQHQSLMRNARPVTARETPALAALAQRAVQRLRPGEVQVYVVPSRMLNAYTFGLDTPKVIVLYSALFEVMDSDEILFILGHEMGHVALGHTWLNSLVGGMAGIPSTGLASALLTLAFLSWNRACELSADRAGLLACGSLEKSVSALIKLVAGPQARTPAGMEMAYRQIDAEDDTFLGPLNEAFASHPMLIRRINELRQFARSSAYRRMAGSPRAGT